MRICASCWFIYTLQYDAQCIQHQKEIVIKVLRLKLYIAQLSLHLYFHSKNGKLQKRGKVNLVGRLQLSTERSKEEDNECIVQLRIFRVQVSSDYVMCMMLHTWIRMLTNKGKLYSVYSHY